MATKHNYFKNYRTIINRGDEINPKNIKANGTYAVAWKEEGNPNTQWGIIVMEDHKIKWCYNLLAPELWIGFPVEDPIKIDFHIFEATAAECDFAEWFQLSQHQEKTIDKLARDYNNLNQYKLDIEHSTWHKIAETLRKFFSV